jgi:hypothetical protein
VHEESIQIKTSNLEVFNYTKQVARYLIWYPLKQKGQNITCPPPSMADWETGR